MGRVEFDPPTMMATAEAHVETGWRIVSLITWVSVLAALIATAISSRTIGQPVWWLGTRFNPAHPAAMLVPLAMVVVPMVTAWRAPQMMVRVNLACSLLLMATVVPDIGDSPAVSLAVVVIASAAFLAAIAQLIGSRKYR